MLFALLIAGHLAAGDATDAATGRSEDQLRDGNLRGLGRRNILHEGRFLDPLLVPLANDSISDEYWARVNSAIRSEGLHTPRPASLNDPAATPTPEPWQKIMSASRSVTVLDSPGARSELTNWEYATPQPNGAEGQPDSSFERQIRVVPYDMQIGAHIMYALTAKAPETPPPTQEWVDQAFISQCPMVMFSNALFIKAPTCGGKQGTWLDPGSGRPILRWGDSAGGGVYMGVDSRVTGDGSVKFAEFQEKMSLKEYMFDLTNCVNVIRFTVEEQIIKVNHMAPNARSTSLEHDVAKSHEAYFYKYIIRATNGTAVASTNLFRMDQSEVNFTIHDHGVNDGPVYAVAKRQGLWSRGGWRECTHTKRGWGIDFVQPEAKFVTLATVQDLRVAAAATITLMAIRDEHVGYDGFQHVGQGYLYWTLVRNVLLVVFILVLLCVVWIVLAQKAPGRKLRRLCFNIEAVFLPKRPVSVRQPMLHPTY